MSSKARATLNHGPRPGRYAAEGFFEGRMVTEPAQKPPTDADPVRRRYKWATEGVDRSSEPAAGYAGESVK